MVNVEDLKELKSRDRFYFDCDYCGKRHSSIVHYLRQQAQKTGRKVFNKYCSKKCKGLAKTLDKKTCTYCGAEYKPWSRKQRYCSRGCSNKDRGKCSKTRRENIRKAIREKVGTSAFFSFDSQKLYPRICRVCKKLILDEKHTKTCSHRCAKTLRLKTVRKRGVGRVRRSKAEIQLFNLMSQEYDCEHNKPIFNGFDADIIIHDLKLAIEWNGPWHYKKMMASHSFRAVKVKDQKKVKEILKRGYRFLVVKDFENDMTPELAHKRIQESIRDNSFNKTIFT